jgi:hypothetical protein
MGAGFLMGNRRPWREVLGGNELTRTGECVMSAPLPPLLGLAFSCGVLRAERQRKGWRWSTEPGGGSDT